MVRGALGVMSTLTLRCVPSFALLADERPEPVEEVLEQFDSLAAANDHFEFYWFPYGRKALVKRNNRLSPAGAASAAGGASGAGGASAAGASSAAAMQAVGSMPGWRRFWEFEVMENSAFGALCRIGRARPRLIPALIHGPVSPGVRDPPVGSASSSPSTPFHVNHWAT